jgi:hypothetical protein
MPSADGPDGPRDRGSEKPLAPAESIERQLFESLVYHLIEKGVLTRNDALSVVQTVAEVKRGELEAGRSPAGSVERQIVLLERLYASFEMVTERPAARQGVDGGNVLQLRPPVHGDKPKFPKDN